MFVSLCEMGVQPKGVITERHLSLHCSNLLEVYYMTGHIHTEISTHLTALKTKISTNYVSGLWGNHGAEGNLPVQLGNGKNRNSKTVEQTLEGESSAIFWLWPLAANQIIKTEL